MNRKIYIVLLLIVVALFFAQTDVDAQCAMCKQAVQSNIDSNDGGRRIGIGLNSGILYLMGIPYMIVATIAVAFFRKQIKEKLQSVFSSR